MTAPQVLTAKGQRTAQVVLRAATRVLARDGYSAASISRIAEEAGVSKRNVLYYYGTREALLVGVVRTVGERVAEHIDANLEHRDEPSLRARALVDTVWASITTAPELAGAYFALLGDGTPEVQAALLDLKNTYSAVIHRHLHPGATHGSPDGISTVVLATLRGLLLEWTETGDTPAIADGLDICTESLARLIDPQLGARGRS